MRPARRARIAIPTCGAGYAERLVVASESDSLTGMADNVLQITPFMHVADIAPALHFFVDVLGFTLDFQQPGYAYVSLEGAGIRILENHCPDELGLPHRGFAYYVDVRDLAKTHEQIAAKLATLPAGDVVGPIDQPYGQRELMIRAPDGNLLVFGQAIA